MMSEVRIREPEGLTLPRDPYWDSSEGRAVISECAERLAERIDAEIAAKIYAEYLQTMT